MLSDDITAANDIDGADDFIFQVIPDALRAIIGPGQQNRHSLLRGNGEDGNFTSLYSSELPHRTVAVYMYLCDRADKDSKCYPAIGTIARELKLSRRTVKRAITDLEKTGHFRKENRWREKKRHVSHD